MLDIHEIRSRRRTFAVQKNIIADNIARIRCPHRTGAPIAETIAQLEAVRVKIAELVRDLEGGK